MAVKLRPADPFDLIRWLARSQSDPRKAVAELVQNSLDAGARRVRIERRRVRGAAAIAVWDDGEGVLPAMARDDALRYIAEHIGHSRKMQLTPAERRERIVAGKYGVGLLGFWSVGHRFELRSRVAGSAVYALRLVEDQPGGDIIELPAPIDAPTTFTEVVVLTRWISSRGRPGIILPLPVKNLVTSSRACRTAASRRSSIRSAASSRRRRR